MPLSHLSGSAALPAYTRATSGCGRINRPSAIASITKATSSRHHGVVAAQLLAHRVAASMAPRRAAEVSEAAQLPLVLGRAPWGRERAGGDRIVGGTAEPNRAGRMRRLDRTPVNHVVSCPLSHMPRDVRQIRQRDIHPAPGSRVTRPRRPARLGHAWA